MPHATEVLADSPGYFWKFEELSGTVADDASPNNRDATLVNGPLVKQPGIDNGLSYGFNGVNSRVEGAYEVSTDFTIEAWVLPTATTPATAANSSFASQSTVRWVFYPSQKGASPNAGVGFAVGTNGLMVGEHGDGHGQSRGWHAYTFPTDRFTHVALRYQAAGGSYEVFIAGVKVATFTRARTTIYSPVMVGSGAYGAQDGLIDNPAMFAAALTDTRILAHANGGVSPDLSPAARAKTVRLSSLDSFMGRTTLGSSDRVGTPFTVVGTVAINTTENALAVSTPASNRLTVAAWAGTLDHDFVPDFDFSFQAKGDNIDAPVLAGGTTGFYIYVDDTSGWMHLRSGITGSDSAVIIGPSFSGSNAGYNTYRVTKRGWTLELFLNGVSQGTYLVPFSKRTSWGGVFGLGTQLNTSYFRNMVLLTSIGSRGVSY